jgi:hypothetical protein
MSLDYIVVVHEINITTSEGLNTRKEMRKMRTIALALREQNPCPIVLTLLANAIAVLNRILDPDITPEQASPVTAPPHSGSASKICWASSKASLKPFRTLAWTFMLT